ncbi:MAG: hypothetical protein SCALA702_04240 [Melioribacteraceae bacterium]|nr:MAG: hypothetical protein SCALA702_04240 [Melioribacteraceae bacterium]
MKNTLFVALLFASSVLAQLSGFNESPFYGEQVITFYYQPEIRVHINAPSVDDFDVSKPTALAFYALPNGNTIEHTVGKVLETGDDWHFDIQHIGAQTRFLRQNVEDANIISIYLEAEQKSWPAWKAAHSNHAAIIQELTSYLTGLFENYDPYIILTGHSGGGRFTFSFLDGVAEIPSSVKRISFLDSNYGYEHSYGDKIINWLNASEDHYLSVIAYNDSVALYNGNPIVSPTGGTWYRSRIMKTYMSSAFEFTNEEDDDFIRYTALEGRIKFILKKNPDQVILHTVQVEKNGHIQGMVSGTSDEGVNYEYYSDRAYSDLIQSEITNPNDLTIPPRPTDARTGSQFMQDVTNMSFAAREDQIFEEVSSGNIPDFMRELVTINANFQDINGNNHTVEYQVMPDYLAIGSNEDFCRIPTGPITAQKIADLFGAVMPTRKLVDNIYTNSDIKLAPVTYTPVGNQNELVPKFIQHNTAITNQFNNANGVLGDLVGGTKKDVVLSNLIIDPNRPNHVVIYGWHQLNGQPIQPLTNIHIDTYTDYSHGIRYLNNKILLDGEVANITDLLKDPTLYKVLSNESGVMVQPTYISDNTLPDKPASFGVKSKGAGSIELMITPDPDVNSYKLYMGTNANSLAYVDDFSGSTIEFNDLDENLIYYFKLQANNDAGSSPESEVLAGLPGVAPLKKVLVVNGFDRGSTGNTYNFVAQYGEAIKNYGAWFETTSNDAVTSGLFDLNDYHTVIYILGEESTADETFSTGEQNIISTYLKNGGNLFVSGSEIAWDLDYKGSTADKSFITNYLKVQYYTDAPAGVSGTYYGITPVATSIFSSLSPFSFDNGAHGTYDVDWPDVFTPVNGGVANMVYTGFNTTNGVASVHYHGTFPSGTQPGSLIIFGVPFETVYPESVRFQIMENILNWFDDVTDLTPNNDDIPTEFSLGQNYPNPFNPVTTIEYSLKEEGLVNIDVFDVKGEKVKTLVNSMQSGGKHNVKFNANNLASGVYFYRVQVLDSAGRIIFSANNKMILMK